MTSWVTFGSLCLLLVVLGISGTRETEINYPEEVGHVFTTIFHKYSERVRPYNNDRDPLDMTIILDVIHINNLDLLKQELDVTMDLSIAWLDTRLNWFFEQVTYIEVNQSSVWTPDVTFLDTSSGVDSLINPRFLVVRRNGLIVWYRRQRALILCEVNQTATIQECNIRLGSRQFPTSELIFKEGICSMNNSIENPNWSINSLNKTMEVGSNTPTNMAFPNAEMSVAQCTLTLEDMTPKQSTSVASELQGSDPEGSGARRVSFELLALLTAVVGVLTIV